MLLLPPITTLFVSLLWASYLEAANVLEVFVVISESGTTKYKSFTGSDKTTQDEITSFMAHINDMFGSSLEIRLQGIEMNVTDSNVKGLKELRTYVQNKFATGNMPDFVLGFDDGSDKKQRYRNPNANACNCNANDCYSVYLASILSQLDSTITIAEQLALSVGVQLGTCDTPAGNWMAQEGSFKNPNYFKPSSCASSDISTFAQKGSGSCLQTTTSQPLPVTKPLGHYIGHHQICSRMHPGTFGVKPTDKDVCSEFYCYINNGVHQNTFELKQVTKMYYAYDSYNETPCGKDKRCLNGKCVNSTSCTDKWVNDICFFGNMPILPFQNLECKDMGLKDCATETIYSMCCKSCNAL